MSIERKPVLSSNIAAIGHEGDVLEVEFKGAFGKPGAVWRYEPVPPALHAKLLAARSIGTFFAREIRYRPGVRASKVETPKPEAKEAAGG